VIPEQRLGVERITIKVFFDFDTDPDIDFDEFSHHENLIVNDVTHHLSAVNPKKFYPAIHP
jgi:hypothetical protein